MKEKPLSNYLSSILNKAIKQFHNGMLLLKRLYNVVEKLVELLVLSGHLRRIGKVGGSKVSQNLIDGASFILRISEAQRRFSCIHTLM